MLDFMFVQEKRNKKSKNGLLKNYKLFINQDKSFIFNFKNFKVNWIFIWQDDLCKLAENFSLSVLFPCSINYVLKMIIVKA